KSPSRGSSPARRSCSRSRARARWPTSKRIGRRVRSSSSRRRWTRSHATRAPESDRRAKPDAEPLHFRPEFLERRAAPLDHRGKKERLDVEDIHARLTNPTVRLLEHRVERLEDGRLEELGGPQLSREKITKREAHGRRRTVGHSSSMTMTQIP